MNKTPALLIVAVLLLAACSSGEAPDTRPGQPVAHRRTAFKNLLKVFEPIGVMMRDGPYDAKKYKELAGEVMAQREAPWQYFLPDTLYPPSKAKPEVWSDASGFEAQKKAFFDATNQLAATAGTDDEKTAKAAFDKVEATCHDCHKAYKNR